MLCMVADSSLFSFLFLSLSQESGGRSGDSYLGTVSDTLLMREAGLTKQVGGVLSSKQYTGVELNETQVSSLTNSTPQSSHWAMVRTAQ